MTTNLCPSQSSCELWPHWSGFDEAVKLERHHGSRVQPQSPRVLRKVPKNVGRIEEPHHGNPGCHVDRVNIVSIDQWVEAGCRRETLSPFPHVRVLCDHFQVFDWLRSHAHTGQCLQVVMVTTLLLYSFTMYYCCPGVGQYLNKGHVLQCTYWTGVKIVEIVYM